MKRLTEPKLENVKNAWGGYVDVVLSDHEVEESDVGREKFHYLGHARAHYKFKDTDVGRTIREDSSTGGCWYFLT